MKNIKGLLIDAKVIDIDKEVIEMASVDMPSFLDTRNTVLLSGPKYRNKQYSRIKYRDGDCKFNFFLDKENEEAVKVFLEQAVQEVMIKTGYEDAKRFRQIKENYGTEISDLLVKKKDDPTVKQQLKRMLDF